LYYSQLLKRPIKPYQAYNIYLTKEQQLQGKADWLVKDSEAWDAMCEWWAFEEFKAISLWNWQNQQSKPSVHHYGVDGYIRKTQRLVRYTLSLFSYVFHINFFITLDSMLQKKSTEVEPHYLNVWLPMQDDDETTAEKFVSNDIKCYA
jgi:hypothetical protein